MGSFFPSFPFSPARTLSDLSGFSGVAQPVGPEPYRPGIGSFGFTPSPSPSPTPQPVGPAPVMPSPFQPSPVPHFPIAQPPIAGPPTIAQPVGPAPRMPGIGSFFGAPQNRLSDLGGFGHMMGRWGRSLF